MILTKVQPKEQGIAFSNIEINKAFRQCEIEHTLYVKYDQGRAIVIAGSNIGKIVNMSAINVCIEVEIISIKYCDKYSHYTK